jgi:hypothetical protein
VIVFTILGVLVYWAFMGLLGFALGWYLDFRRGITLLLEPADEAIDRELMELRAILDYWIINNERGSQC